MTPAAENAMIGFGAICLLVLAYAVAWHEPSATAPRSNRIWLLVLVVGACGLFVLSGFLAGLGSIALRAWMASGGAP